MWSLDNVITHEITTSSVNFPCGRSSERSYFLSKCVILRRLPKVSWLLKDSNQNACDTSHGQSRAGQYRAGQCGAGPCRARSMQGQGQRRSRVNTGQGRLVSPGQGRRRSRWRVNTAGRQVRNAGQHDPQCSTTGSTMQGNRQEQGKSNMQSRAGPKIQGKGRTKMQGKPGPKCREQGRAGQERCHMQGRSQMEVQMQGSAGPGLVQCRESPVQGRSSAKAGPEAGERWPPTSSCWTWTIVPTTIDDLW